MTRREYGMLLAALLGRGMSLGRAQPPPESDQDSSSPSTVIRVDVDLVNILFTVRKKKGGALVPNLAKDDFNLYEDGKEQTISRFTRESDLPLTLGLLVDVSASQVNLIEIERQAASAFFADVIRPKDEAFLIAFGRDTELLQDLTGSPRALKAALRELRGDVTGGPGGGPRGPVATTPGTVPDMGPPKGTLLFDAVYLAANEKLKAEVGRKAVILITDGEDQGSYYKRDQAIEAAQRADTIIYSIYYVDRAFYWSAGMGVGGGESDLRKMSDQTGGRVFVVDKNHTLQDVFKEIQDEMRNQYVIAYKPNNPVRDGKFRKIDIRVRDKDDLVQARKGYYATRNDAA
ncbi:MAG: VWA domain-containing protein [Bryobacteraceae bacterium]